MGFEILSRIYTLCFHEKKLYFFNVNLKHISLYTLCFQKKKLCLFDVEFPTSVFGMHENQVILNFNFFYLK